MGRRAKYKARRLLLPEIREQCYCFSTRAKSPHALVEAMPCSIHAHTHNLFHMDPLSSSACRDLPRSSLALAQRKCCGTAFDETWREDVDYDARDLHEDLLSKRVVARSFQSLDVKAQEKSTGLPELHSRGSLPGLQAGDSPGLCEAGFEGSRDVHRASRAPFQGPLPGLKAGQSQGLWEAGVQGPRDFHSAPRALQNPRRTKPMARTY